MSLQVVATIPILRIFSVEKAKEFYVGFLGFQVDWEHRFEGVAPVYMQVSRAGCVLHLSEHHGDGCPGSTVFLRVTGLEGYHREITAKGYGYLRPGIEPTFHNTKCMEVLDPFGNRLRFDETLPPAPEPKAKRGRMPVEAEAQRGKPEAKRDEIGTEPIARIRS